MKVAIPFFFGGGGGREGGREGGEVKTLQSSASSKLLTIKDSQKLMLFRDPSPGVSPSIFYIVCLAGEF